MKKLTALLAALFLCLTTACALAELRWTSVPDAVRPGEKVRYHYLAEAGTVRIELLNADGSTALLIRGSQTAEQGVNSFRWDAASQSLTAGDYLLRLTQNGQTADAPLRLTGSAPELVAVDADEMLSASWSYAVSANCAGTLTAALEGTAGRIALPAENVNPGLNRFTWDASALGEGVYTLTVFLTDAAGLRSDAAEAAVSMPAPPSLKAADIGTHTPADGASLVCSHTDCIWTLPMGCTDEDAVWRALTSPMVVLNGDQRHQLKVRAKPDKNCKEYTGEVTYESQGVHVLKEEKGWAFIGSYSSSVEGSSVAVFSDYFEGWVESSLLKTVQPSTKYGVVIDKLTQRLYVYKGGKLWTTLKCSTGYAQKGKRFQETPAGEFRTISWSGGFWSSNLWCDMGIRINDGILLHEVPILITTDENGNEVRNTERCENYLGDRASHGCIRIQRRKTPEGVNMKWLWDNLERGTTRVLIWDDKGRELGYPSDELVLYYNPRAGRMYHSAATCSEVNEKYWPLAPFTYGELDVKPYSKLKPCPACAPEPTHAAVDKLNKDRRK